ncbi:hypothetical protein [Pseudomonas aeruginosa]|uniref:hypothetical protein n=1 Tax=Pseudomonas aeruginosa TaxID=287 RepID=UPI0021F16B79|nr:hypothetical protein [Pseudomonas aeruginosa]MCV6429386.1 hypothetical protein [Pseudomonas aeruginosa]MCV6437382.1 hypothetical protein [Pseudomonas aeruginosa]
MRYQNGDDQGNLATVEILNLTPLERRLLAGFRNVPEADRLVLIAVLDGLLRLNVPNE